jgi:hypothetical protein
MTVTMQTLINHFSPHMQAQNLYAIQIGPELYSKGSRDSGVGIVAGYRLDDQRVGVRAPVFLEFSLLLVVQTGSGAHPPIQWVPWPFFGIKEAGT